MILLKVDQNVKKLRLQYRNLQISVFLMLHPIYFLPTLYTDTDMSIFGMVIVLAFQILLMGFTASFSKGTQQYESWHEFPIDLLYKDVSSLDTKWRILASCPNSQYIGTLGWSRVSIYWEFGHGGSSRVYTTIYVREAASGKSLSQL